MEPQRIFEELMKADELQTHLGISKENVVANNKATNTVFQGILKKVSD